MGAVVSRMQGSAVPGVPPNVDLSPDYYDARFVKSAGSGTGRFFGARSFRHGSGCRGSQELSHGTGFPRSTR